MLSQEQLVAKFGPDWHITARRAIEVAEAELAARAAKRAYTESLTQFLKGAWRWVDPADYQDSWAIDALCEHLEAVTHGDIKRLLINFPPRCGKSNVASIAWPAWTWAQSPINFTSGPQVKFLCSSYAHMLGIKLSNKMRRLVMSPWFQERWPIELLGDQNTKSDFENIKGGGRSQTSVSGSLLGIGGDIIVVDDPHDTEAVESEVQRETAINHWSELSSTRLNDPKRSAIVVIMQRLHESDVSGNILSGDDAGDWTHLMLPMEFDRGRKCTTVLKWDEHHEPELVFTDPRERANELLWPERFGPAEVDKLKRNLGPYMASGRLQQSPSPAGGGIIRREWWQDWPSDTFPRCEYVLASLDTAYTEKTENDPSALTIWGVFRDAAKNPKVILLWAWDGRLELHDLVVTLLAVCQKTKLPDDEAARVIALMSKTGQPIKYLPNLPVDRLIIELKATGYSVAQEINRLCDGSFGVEGIKVNAGDGDKVSRLYSVQHLFSDMCVYAPDRKFAERVIDQVTVFPKGVHDDYVDTTSQALRYLRESGLLLRRSEQQRIVHEELIYKPTPKALY